MIRYILRRLGWSLITVIGVALVTFLVVHTIPADPALAIAGPHATEETIISIRNQLGLDRPLYVQFGDFLWKLAQGDLGTSFFNDQPVRAQIAERLPATLRLGVAGFLAQLLIGIPAGALAALRQNTWVDRVLSGGVSLGLSTPEFWLGVMLLFLFAFKLPLFPLAGDGTLAHLVLPALTIGITGAAYYARLLRTSMIEIKAADYAVTARAKGLSETRVAIVHVMRSALIPVVTWAGIDLAKFFSGLVVTETVFGWPGVGHMTFTAIQNLDVPLIIGVVMLSAVMVVTASLVVDILYLFLDPRISYD